MTENPPLLHTAVPDDRNLGQLTADIHQGVHQLRTALAGVENGLTDRGQAELDQIVRDIASQADLLAGSGLDRQPATGDTDAHEPETAADLIVALYGDVGKLLARLQQLGLHDTTGSGGTVQYSLLHAIDVLEELAAQLAEERPDAAAAVAPAFKVPAPALNTRPLEGTRPGARISPLDIAGRGLENRLRADNGTATAAHFSPLDHLADHYAGAAAASDRPQTYTTAGAREARTPKPQPTYKHEPVIYQSRPRNS